MLVDVIPDSQGSSAVPLARVPARGPGTQHVGRDEAAVAGRNGLAGAQLVGECH